MHRFILLAFFLLPTSATSTAAPRPTSCFDTVIGTPSADTIDKSASLCNETIDGRGGDDQIAAGSGDDVLTGGADADTLTGGTGSNVFTYARPHDGRIDAEDTITDFKPGIDRIDVSALCGYLGIACRFIGNDVFHGIAGEISYSTPQIWQCDPVTGVCGDIYLTLVIADLDGDGNGDFGITIPGQHFLEEPDFILTSPKHP